MDPALVAYCVDARAGGVLSATENVDRRRPISLGGSTRRRRISVVAGAAIPALLYLVYVFHYAVNVPIADDWNVIGLASAAIHHQLTMNELWAQYGDTRLFMSFLFLVTFGVLDHLNEKTIILCSAVVFIVTFVMVLSIFKAYLGRRLNFLPVISLGIMWFSLADVQNALWSFQLAWYFVIFAFVAITYLLLIPRRHRNRCVALGIFLAVAASLAEVQGFVVWPAALICILWGSPWARRTYYESAVWVSALVLTTAVYLHGFSFAMDTNICVLEGGTKARCSLSFGLLHPTELANFFIVLVGNVVPTTQGTFILLHQVLGAVICIAAGYVVVQSVRERPRQPNPLPLVLVAFALMFDLILALSRLGEGLLGAGLNRYTMPNLILVVGIVTYAWAHLPRWPDGLRRATTVDHLRTAGWVVLVGFLLVQCVVATQFGISNGGTTKATSVTVARVVVNLDEIPRAERECYFTSVVVGPPLFVLERARMLAMQDQLSLFHGSEDSYRRAGPPRIARCDHP